VTVILVTVALLVGIVAVVYVLGLSGRSPGPAPSKRPPAKLPPRDMRLGAQAPRSEPMRSTPAPKRPGQRSAFARSPWWLRVLPVVLLIGAVASIGVAVSKFRVEKNQNGPIVMLAIDTSQSMGNAKPGTRLAAAQDAARSFVDSVPPNFRVGLVAFDAKASVLAPPSTDRAQVDAALQDLFRDPPPGTVMGDGLASALQEIQGLWLADAPVDSAVILLSDGVNQGGTVDTDTATKQAQTLGVPVYTVAIVGNDKGNAGKNALASIASTTGGTPANVATGNLGSLNGVYTTLGSKLSSELKISSSAQRYVLLAILLAVGAAILVLLRIVRERA